MKILFFSLFIIIRKRLRDIKESRNNKVIIDFGLSTSYYNPNYNKLLRFAIFLANVRKNTAKTMLNR